MAKKAIPPTLIDNLLVYLKMVRKIDELVLSPVENGGAFRGKMAARGMGIFTTWGSG